MPPSMVQEIRQTKQFHQESFNLQVLKCVLPVSNKETINGDRESGAESNGTGWSSLYSLSTPKDSLTDLVGNTTYKNSKESHLPMTSFFKKTISGTDNNLDMYTETLGCETGTMYTTDDYKRDGLLSDAVEGLTLEVLGQMRRERKELLERRIKRVKTGTELPPALKTRTGKTCLRIVRERDEDGRMVMYAVNQQSMLKAERKDGRLRLCLSTSCNKKEAKGEGDEEVDHLGLGVDKAKYEKKNGGDEMETKKLRLNNGGEGMEKKLRLNNGGEGMEKKLRSLMATRCKQGERKVNYEKDNGGEEIEKKLRFVMAARCKEGEKRENWEAESIWVASS